MGRGDRLHQQRPGPARSGVLDSAHLGIRAAEMMVSPMKRFGLALFAAVAIGSVAAEASAQEVQVTGPLAGAPAYRRLRLHREGRFDIAPHATFTLLDEFRRGIMPGLRLN